MNAQDNAYKKGLLNPEVLVKKWNFTEEISSKEKKGLAVIIGHPGKRTVFESYMETDHRMAMKYLTFISRNPHVHYIRWDIRKEEFVTAS